MKQKYMWMTLGMICVLIYISAAFYFIITMEEPKQDIWKQHSNELVIKLDSALQDDETIRIEDHQILIQKDDKTYTFTSDTICAYEFTKEMMIDQEKYRIYGKLTIDFEQEEIEIYTNIDQWLEEKSRYEDISIGSNRYLLQDLDSPINSQGAFVDSAGKALAQHHDIEAFIGFDEVKCQVLQMKQYHYILIASLEELAYFNLQVSV